jgi:two-component system OmpR family sensor kinase
VRHSSLRWRVTVVVIAVAALLVVGVGVVVDLVLEQELNHQLDAQLSVHVQRATMLIQQGVPADQMVRQLHDRAVLAEIQPPGAGGSAGTDAGAVSPNGGANGGPSGGSNGGSNAAADGAAGPGAGHTGPYHLVRPGDDDRTESVAVPLPDGSRLVLTTNDDNLDTVRDQLRVLLAWVGGVGLVLAAGAMLLGVRAALRPLDTMTRLAEAITAGDRGRRLRPGDPDTELGRTAAAFDAMLDALESAQAAAEAAAGHARQAEVAARRSEATLRRFLSDAAHELRTPLTGMQGLAETLVRHPDLELSRREDLATTMVRETRRATHLVAEMLELAHIEGGLPLRRRNLGLVTLAELAEEEVRRTRLLAPALTVTLDADPPAELDGLAVLADEGRISQVVSNLLNNARRHTPEGGTVRVSVRHTGTDALLTVSDSGPGVPAADRERIFDRLVRLDDARARDSGGAGLGLPIARALARAHGGELAYLPHDDGTGTGSNGNGSNGNGSNGNGSGTGGAAFQLRLPLAAPAPADGPTEGPTEGPTDGLADQPTAQPPDN